jgi:hypothetical protein
MEEQKQAADIAGFLGHYWEAVIGFTMAVVIAPYVKWNHKRVDAHRVRLTALEAQICNSKEVRDIVSEENAPLQKSLSQLIDRMGQHNDNVTERMNQLSDIMTNIAMHVGPSGPRNRRDHD